jgi:hypothetical protein
MKVIAMRATISASVSGGVKICRICQEAFVPHPKVRDRQKVCSGRDCQRLRQKLNHQEWLEKNPVNYQQWYIDYGKPWRVARPDYQRKYRQRRKSKPIAMSEGGNIFCTRKLLNSLLKGSHAEKKEELSSVKTSDIAQRVVEEKEELRVCFYLLKAHKLMVLPLSREKKEELACYFS